LTYPFDILDLLPDNELSGLPYQVLTGLKKELLMHEDIPITHSQLVEGFRRLGVEAGQIVMLHASYKAVGAVMGGPNVVLQALLDVLTPSGTLMMYVGWEDLPYLNDTPMDERQVHYDEHPAFDPRTAHATRWNGILAEFLRTWPDAHRSENPENSMVAVGAQAAWLTRDHPLNYGYGTGSPLAKLIEAKGKVLMLGASLDKITLLHHAENLARMRHKQVVHYQWPILRDGKKVWVEIEDYDTGDPHDDYTFERIGKDYVAQGGGMRGVVGNAESYLFDAADICGFAVRWLEERFGA
jgi:aminoglycoside 3-N-acetyltransferase